MDYFAKQQVDDSCLNEALSKIEDSARSFYAKINLKDGATRLHSSTLGSDELLAFCTAFLEGNITVGSYNETFQKLAANIFNSSYAVTSNSGSSANLLAISALVQTGRLRPGDRVIVPALAWSTTVFPLVQYGLVPIYVDIDPNNFNIDLSACEEAIHEYQPRVLMAIHTYGNPLNIDKILEICNSANILLIEDTCESMGAKWKGKSVGSFGIAGTYSSYFSHHICTLEGGLTITDDSELLQSMLSIRSHGWTRGTGIDISSIPDLSKYDPTFLFVNCGYNLRLSDPQAAIGIVQLNKLTTFVSRRQNTANHYIDRILNSPILSEYACFPQVHPDAESSWFGFPLFFPKLNKRKVDALRFRLKETGIESRPFLAGDFSSQPVNKAFTHIRHNLNNIKLFHESSFALPCHQDVSLEEVDKICDQLINQLSN